MPVAMACPPRAGCLSGPTILSTPGVEIHRLERCSDARREAQVAPGHVPPVHAGSRVRERQAE